MTPLARRRRRLLVEAAERRLAAGPPMLAQEANPRARAGILRRMSVDLEGLAGDALQDGSRRYEALTNSYRLLMWAGETECVLASVIEEGPDNQWSLMECLAENGYPTPWPEAWPALEALCVEPDRVRRCYLLGRLHHFATVIRARPLTAAVTSVIDAYWTGTW